MWTNPSYFHFVHLEVGSARLTLAPGDLNAVTFAVFCNPSYNIVCHHCGGDVSRVMHPRNAMQIIYM